MRTIIVALTLLVAAPALAADAPRYHESYSAGYQEPLWKFYHYPRGIPKNLHDAKTPGYKYYPYAPYRTDYPGDNYNRNKSQRYPVR